MSGQTLPLIPATRAGVCVLPDLLLPLHDACEKDPAVSAERDRDAPDQVTISLFSALSSGFPCCWRKGDELMFKAIHSCLVLPVRPRIRNRTGSSGEGYSEAGAADASGSESICPLHRGYRNSAHRECCDFTESGAGTHRTDRRNRPHDSGNHYPDIRQTADLRYGHLPREI